MVLGFLDSGPITTPAIKLLKDRLKRIPRQFDLSFEATRICGQRMSTFQVIILHLLEETILLRARVEERPGPTWPSHPQFVT